MGAIDLIRSIFARSEQQVPVSPFFKILSSASPTSKPSQRMTQSNMGTYLEKYADQAWVYSCIRIIQTKAAGVPLKIYRKQGDEFIEIPDHPVKKLLDSVNENMNGYDLLEGTHGYLELAGNAYWLLDAMIDNKPTEIHPLNPKMVKILVNKEKGITGYTYELTPGVIYKTFTPEEIVHFKTWNPLDPFYGMAPLCAARDSVDTITFSDQYNKAFFQNGAQPGGILTSDQGIDDESKKRIDMAWGKRHGKPHKLAILDNGLKYQAMSESHQDMQFTELKRMSREDVLTVFNMPPIMVGVFDEANYSNAKEQRRIFWIDCIIPRLRKIESVINERLVKQFDPTVIAKHDLSGVEDLAEDSDLRARADSSNVMAGIKLVNEIRKEKNLKPVAWGNTWWAPMGVSPVDISTGKPEEPEPPEEPQEPTPPPAPPPAKAITVKEEPAPALREPVLEDPKKVNRDQVWIRYKGLTERLENKWAAQMRQLFADQEREVIGNLQNSDWLKIVRQNKLDKMRNVKQSIDVILFDRTKSRTIFRKTAHVLMSKTIKASADAEIDQYDLGIDFKLNDPNVTLWINSKAFKFADAVNKTTEDALRDELVQAINAGDTITQVEERIARIFDIAKGSRTATIARTEVISASNQGAFESYKQSGVVESTEWVSARDGNVRHPTPEQPDIPDHTIDGEEVKLGHKFSNGLMYPGDPAGEPENVINCRCTIAPIVEKGE